MCSYDIDQGQGIRALSLQGVAFTDMPDQVSRLGALFNYRSLMMLNLRNVSGIDMVQELQVLHLPSVQLLNLNLSIKHTNQQWQLKHENMPMLKELFCRGNHLQSIYHFSQLHQLKLLDVAHNSIQHVLADQLPPNLLVLNIIDNPLQHTR